MTTFEVGFIDHAKESGLSASEAAHFLKRAFEYPGAEQMLEHLPDNEQEQTPDDLESLMHLIKQDALHELVLKDKHKIHI